MTLSAWRTIVYTLLAGALLGAIAVPAVDHDVPDAAPSSLQQVEQVAERRVRVHNEYFRRAQSYDDARDALRQTATNTDKFQVVAAQGIPAAFAAVTQTRLLWDFATLPRRDAEVRVLSVIALDTSATSNGVAIRDMGGYWSVDRFNPGVVAPHTCAIVVHTSRRTLRNASLPGRRLTGPAMGFSSLAGPCWWYAAYGLPGKGIAAWIDSTHSHALMPRPSGVEHVYNRESEFTRVACKRRGGSACSTLLLSATIADDNDFDAVPTPGWTGEGRNSGSPYNSAGAWVLLALAGEIGPEQFHEFWKSDLPLPDAFAAAAGRPMNEWIHDHLQAYFAWTGNDESRPSRGLAIALVIAIPGLLAIGVRSGRT